jgi:hypothetical protein
MGKVEPKIDFPFRRNKCDTPRFAQMHCLQRPVEAVLFARIGKKKLQLKIEMYELIVSERMISY